MRRYKKLKEELNEAKNGINNSLQELDKTAKESKRVANIAHNAEVIINDIDRQFSQLTGLNNTDISFLFLATALQCARQYILSNNKFYIEHDIGSDLAKYIVPKQWQTILTTKVPYDIVAQDDAYKNTGEGTKISGRNHRYATLGHDPILGWIFGPMNILTDSLTRYDFLSFKIADSKIAGKYSGGTPAVFNDSVMQIKSDKKLLPVAVGRQALHFGSDYFTKQSLPVPLISSMNYSFSKDLVEKYNVNMWSLTKSVTLAVMINSLVECIHLLFYNEQTDRDISLYQVRTRKILSYSNIISSGSNIISTAVTGNCRSLDVGGILVTLYRLISDHKFINEIKREFIANEFYKLVMNEPAQNNN